MAQSWQQDNSNNREQTGDMLLHFVNGNLRLDERTIVPSSVLHYKATIYSEEYIGEVEESDVTIGYNEDQQVWVTVESSDGSSFTWHNWETDRKVVILFYILTYDREYLLYCSNKNFFCYLTIPQKDPRQDRIGRIPNTHLNTTYQVLNELLNQTNPYLLKVIPRWFEG